MRKLEAAHAAGAVFLDGDGRVRFRDPAHEAFAEAVADFGDAIIADAGGELSEALDLAQCIHPGVFAQGPVPGTEYCGTCGRDVPRHLL